jgi:predicted permease
MARLREWLTRFVGSVRPARRDRDLESELRAHQELAVEQAQREGRSAGRSADATRREVILRTGGLTQAAEAMRDQRGLPWLEDAGRDVRYAIRLLRRSPGFTTAAVLALALGIGINTTVFTAYRAMVTRSLDARNPGELVNIALAHPSGATTFAFSYPDYEAYREASRTFTGLVAFSPDRLTLSNAGPAVSQRASAAQSGAGKLGLLSSGVANAEFASTYVVSENYFSVLGVGAVRGRTFEFIDPADLVASPSVLISENYWERRFGSDPDVLGRVVHLNGAAVTIAGMTPRDFVGTGVAVPDFWLPIHLAPLVHGDENWLRDRENERYRLFARLAPGGNLGQAQAEVNGLADRLRTQHAPGSDSAQPATALVWPGSPFPLPIRLYGGLSLAIALIMAAAAMVLAVACANVGGLQLARGRSRQDELHTRLSLGASRARVIRQLLTESAVLGLVAGSAALACSWAFLKIAVALMAAALPPEFGTLIFDVAPSLPIFAFTTGISLMAGVLFGLTPALESSRVALVSSARGASSSGRSRRTQNVLIAAQVALCLVLLVAGSLLIRSSIRSLTTDPGYEVAHVVSVTYQFPEGSRYTAERKKAVARALRSDLAALPGVTTVTSAQPPAANGFLTGAFAQDGSAPSAPERPLVVRYAYVEANYFQTLGIPLALGRGFQSSGGRAEHGLVLSRAAANLLFPGQDPIGRSLRLGATDERLRLNGRITADGAIYQVVDVAGDTRGLEFDGSDSRTIYLPLTDDRLASRPVLLRTAADPADVTRSIDQAVAAVDPALLTTTTTLAETLRHSPPFVVSSLAAAVASTVGLVGLLLAVMGIYGTVTYVVALRTREVGIRMAIGAQRRDILRLILRESARPVLGGVVVGVVLAVGASASLRGVLFGVPVVDAVSFIGVSALLLAIALLAAYPPSRRALRVDPIVALRSE